jgi:hypothetical protein
MISPEKIAEIAPLYEEYNCAVDPGLPSVLQAKLVFDSECRKIYSDEPVATRAKWTFERYVADCIIPDLVAHLKQRQSKYPTIQPERKS